MPRIRRKISATDIYHVIIRGINKEKVFADDYLKQKVCQLIRELNDELPVEIYAYCVMDNHLHLLIKAKIDVLSKYMQKLGSSYGTFYNRKHNERNGYVFQGRFRSECVETEKYFWVCVRYIHKNPEKAKMVKNYVDYKFSSIKEYNSRNAGIIHIKALKMFENHYNNQNDFIEFHHNEDMNLLLDTEEEMDCEKDRIAKSILVNLMNEKHISIIDTVFDSPKIRTVYQDRITGTLNLGKAEARRIMARIRFGTGQF